MKKIFVILSLVLLCSEALIAQTRIGYTNGTFSRTDGVRVGTEEKQGLAIKLTKEKLRLLKGKKIIGIRAVFGTRNVENLNFFITKAFNQESEFQQLIDEGASTNWKDFELTTPYVITDDSELYVGYTLNAATTYRPLAFDRSNEIEGVSWAYAGDNTWVDVYGKGFGCANLFLLVEDVNPFTDLCLKTFSVQGYYKAEQAYVYSGQVLNFGNQVVNSFDVTYQIGDNEPVVSSFTGKNIAPNETLDFDLPEYTSMASGYLPIKISINNINGADDVSMEDNADNTNIYIYPATIEKKIMIEGFTGQECSRCPAGHRVVSNVVEQSEEELIEIFHHAGYTPDSFTMMEDAEYCCFYNDGSQYAPALMVNRLLNPDLGTSGPVFGVSEKNLETTIEKAAAIQPYVSVNIENVYNEESRELKATVKVHTYVKPESEINTLNVFIVQDSILASQSSAGNKYVHRYAFRGALTSAWGVAVNLTEGQEMTREFTYELPEAILSTYQGVTSFNTELKNMYLVAFVSAYSEDVNKRTVYNCDMAKFSENTTTGVKETNDEPNAIRVSVNGNVVHISGEYTDLQVCDAAGKLIEAWDSPVESFTLGEGFYLIRMLCDGKLVSRKVMIVK